MSRRATADTGAGRTPSPLTHRHQASAHAAPSVLRVSSRPGNVSVHCYLTNAAAPVVAVGQVFGSTLAASASRLFRFVPDGTYTTYIVTCSVTAACSNVSLSTQQAAPPSPSSFLASSSNVTSPPPSPLPSSLHFSPRTLVTIRRCRFCFAVAFHSTVFPLVFLPCCFQTSSSLAVHFLAPVTACFRPTPQHIHHAPHNRRDVGIPHPTPFPPSSALVFQCYPLLCRYYISIINAGAAACDFSMRLDTTT